jgi:hypothetical protein
MTAIPFQLAAPPGGSRGGPRGAVSGAEAARQLESLVQEAAATGTAREALLLLLSSLPRAQPHHLRLAVDALRPLTLADRARLFLLPGHDAAIVWRGAAPDLLAESLARLRTLFADAVPAETLTRHLVLPADGAVLLAAIAAGQRPAVAAVPEVARSPLDAPSLAALEAALGAAELSRFARRRPVCALAPGGGMRLAWETRRFSLTELAETLAPGRDLKAEPWLFRRLTRVLDQRMMALVSAPRELDGAGPFALPLNIASVLSPAFLRFDAALPARLRGAVAIVLRPEDVLADPPAFLFARGFVQARGFRLVLGGIDATLAGAFPPAATGFDHVELVWQAGLTGTTLAELGVSPSCVVLSGVACAAALEWALSQSVAHVSGVLARPNG